jgi:peptide/nickel transport system permease protein
VRAVLRRLIQLVVVVVIVTFFTSILTAFLPGDPVTTIAPFATEQQRADIRHTLGLDRNVVNRYGEWLGGFVQGDMGIYYRGAGLAGDPVSERAKSGVPRSLLLMLYAQILTLLIAVPLGVYTAYRAGTRTDQWSNGVAFALVALPSFVLAAVLKLYLGVQWKLLPTTGWTDLASNATEHFKHLVMPVVTLAVGQIAVYARLLRSDMVATLQEDFFLMAKSKGIPNRRILWRHALRPSSLTLLTVAGLNVGALVSGALIVERIFSLGGIGSLIYEAIGQRQYMALQSYVAIVAIIYVLVNFVVDLLYTVLDPRIRSARALA